MKKTIYLAVLLTSLSFMAFSQNESEFKPNGKPLALIFTNFHADFNNSETIPAFEIQRAYLGYEYNFSKEWYAKVVLDVANPGTGKLEMTAFLKNAYFSYKKNNFSAYFGMISTTQFKVSEKIWGNRYIEKSFQDAYKFNASADLGFNLEYKFGKVASIDFSVINGEGYKKLQADSLLRPGAGITLTPFNKMKARFFVDSYGKDVKQNSLATFVAYTGSDLTLGAEYNIQKNYGMVDSHDLSGISIYANYNASKKVKLFGRFDNFTSNTLEGESHNWNMAKDGQLILAGVEFNPVKGVKLTPNFRGWNPADESQKFMSSIYFNCELKF